MQDGQMSTLKGEAGMKEEQSENIAGNMMESWSKGARLPDPGKKTVGEKLQLHNPVEYVHLKWLRLNEIMFFQMKWNYLDAYLPLLEW